MENKYISFFIYLFVVFVGAATVLPLFHSGFFPMHDDTQVARVFEMGKSLKDGMFPVRWVEDLGYGYGYPIFNFYAPFSYYIGGILTAFLQNALLATKIMIGLGILCSAITMYLLGKSLWGKTGGIIASALYVYAPFHAVDIYVRGDIAEMWAYAFFPLALYGVWQVYKSPTWKNMAIGAIGFAGVIVSHNLSALLFSPFLFLCVAIVTILGIKQKTKGALFAPLILLFGMLCSVWYVLPVFAELRFTNVLSQVGGGADFRNHYVCLSQLWQSQWGYGGSAPGCIDGLSYMIGKLQILLGLVSLITIPFFWKKHKELVSVYLLCIACLLLSIFLMLPVSRFVWESFHPFAFLQYPWRFLLMTSLFISLVGGSVGWMLMSVNKKIGAGIAVFLCIFIAFFSQKYFIPQAYVQRDTAFYTNHQQLIWTTSKISDEYMPIRFVRPTKISQIPQSLVSPSSIQYSLITNTTNEKKLAFSVERPAYITFSLAYFPAWEAYVDGKKQKTLETKQGMQLYMQKGTHTVVLSFRQTPVEQIGNVLSLASIALLVLGIIYTQKKKTV